MTAGRPWRRVRAAVLDRDGHQCVQCRSTEHLEADHITPVAKGGTDDLENLRTLCRRCHRKVTAAKGGSAPRSRAVDHDLIDMSESRRLRDR
ncbi:HNH endonuclease [Rhodococcus sp. IEGM 1408]|uniref:HNH endonuclease n=1 Tax=Rhodococcus sp. IEGM 1408 TaxID=3082220 RepID=UPI0029554A87|nr:HNH endonuclease [Rhodococcus sp. IEGM 1408]MDV8000754.1 HNH endonuclease [Rhodococcus sp. IEGM 1408]